MPDRLCSGELEYEILSDSTVCLRKWTGQHAHVSIPETVAHQGTIYRVTEIDAVFQNIPGLVRVDIPDSVTRIGAYAFVRCAAMTTVTIPHSVIEIGRGAFKGCTALTSVAIPDSVTKIGEEAFKGCTSLASVTIPDSVKAIPKSAFEDCTGLTARQAADGMRMGAKQDNTEHLVQKIVRRELNLESMSDIDESLPVDWQRVLEALVASYFERAEDRAINQWGGTTVVFLRYTHWFAQQDWVTSLHLCVKRAGDARNVLFEYGGYWSSRASEAWLPSDLRVIETLYEAGAKCAAFGGKRPAGARAMSLLEDHIRAMMMYGQADVVKAIFQREGFDASVVEVTERMIDGIVKCDNGSALRWVFEMHPETVELVKDSISKLFDEHRYSIMLALIEQRPAFKSPNVDMYFAYFARENDVGAVKTLLDKGAVVKSNAPKVESALKGMKTEAAGMARDYIARLFAPRVRPAASDQRESGETLSADEVRKLNKRLAKAVKGGDAQAVAETISAGAQPAMIEDIVGLAARRGDVQTVELLLKAGAKPGQAMFLAAESGDLATVQALLKRKVSATSLAPFGDRRQTPRGYTDRISPLEHAAAKSTPEIVRAMLASGQKVNPKDAVMALEKAVLSGNLEMAKTVWEGIGEFEYTSGALALAAEHGYADIAVYLASKGATLDYRKGGYFQQLVDVAKFQEQYLPQCDYDHFFYQFTGSASLKKRLAVMVALEENGLLTQSDKTRLLSMALLYDEPAFARKLDEWGVKLVGVFLSSIRTDGQRRVYSLISDYLDPDQSPEMVDFICERLEDGELVRIKSSWLKPSRGKPDVGYLACILLHSDGDHCDNNTELMRILAAADRADALAVVESWGIFTKRNLDEAIKVALDSQATRVVAYLVDCNRRLFGAGGDLKL